MKLRVALGTFLAFSISLSLFSGTVLAESSDNGIKPQNTQNVSIGVSTYDFQTHSWASQTKTVRIDPSLSGESSPGYFPKRSESPSATINGIIGGNDINPVSSPTTGPYCETVSLQITTPSGGTDVGSGFMLGPYAVVTAAHCLTNASSIIVAPARIGDTFPFGQETDTASSFVISSDYLNGNTAMDWGIIILSNPLGNSTGWLGLHWQSTYTKGTSVNAYGYPASFKGKSTHYTMYQSSGSIQDSSTNYLKGNWDMTGGFSGGPLEVYDSTYGYMAVGILKDGNATGSDGSSYPTAFSGATRITQAIYNIFMAYRPS